MLCPPPHGRVVPRRDIGVIEPLRTVKAPLNEVCFLAYFHRDKSSAACELMIVFAAGGLCR